MVFSLLPSAKLAQQSHQSEPVDHHLRRLVCQFEEGLGTSAVAAVPIGVTSFNSWCVLSCHWGTILIYTFNNNRVWCPNKLLVRCESDRSIWRYLRPRLGTSLRLLPSSKVAGVSYPVVHSGRHQQSLVYPFAEDLVASARHGGACWSYLFHYRLVLNCNRVPLASVRVNSSSGVSPLNCLSGER